MTDKDTSDRNVASIVEKAEKLRKLTEGLQFPSFAPPPMPRFELPEIDIPTPEERNEFQGASVFMQALARDALKWKESLPENLEPAIVAFLYGGVQVQVSAMTQVSFHGIRIEGRLGESPCVLLAHQSTVQVLCVGQERHADEPRNPIGFVWSNGSAEI